MAKRSGTENVPSLEQLGDEQREQIRNYREYVESDPVGGVRGDPPPTVKQVVIGDTEFAEQVLHRRRGVVMGARLYVRSG
jgi:hypothetical protein